MLAETSVEYYIHYSDDRPHSDDRPAKNMHSSIRLDINPGKREEVMSTEPCWPRSIKHYVHYLDDRPHGYKKTLAGQGACITIRMGYKLRETGRYNEY